MPYFFTAKAYKKTTMLEPFDEECSLRKYEMSKVVLFIATSLDSHIASPDGSVDWLFHDADYGYTEFMASVDAASKES